MSAPRPPWSRRALLGAGLAAGGLSAASLAALGLRPTSRRPGAPNLILILTDDQGLDDLGCYYLAPTSRAPRIETPNLDAMAASGVLLSNFYVAASLCTPSRAALLTGCYPPRVGFGAKESGPGVLTPQSRTGLPPETTTLAELLSSVGYRTACVGKWHLGHLPPFRPTRQGFDEFFGIPWSNNQEPLWLVRGEKSIEPITPDTPLTETFTSEAISFLSRPSQDPFFLYLAYSAPHEPLAVSPAFWGRSARGRYGDAIVEIDHHIGLLLSALADRGLDSQTLVVFASDNGPDRSRGDRFGSAGPLRGGKGDTWEGGYRSPSLWRWKGVLPEGARRDHLLTALDLLPTFASLAGAPLPSSPIDGLDVWPAISRGEPPPERPFFYYARGRLEAVRNARYKRVFSNPVRTPPTEAALYDLFADPGEQIDVSSAHPDVIAELDAAAASMRSDLGDSLMGAR